MPIVNELLKKERDVIEEKPVEKNTFFEKNTRAEFDPNFDFPYFQNDCENMFFSTDRFFGWRYGWKTYFFVPLTSSLRLKHCSKQVFQPLRPPKNVSVEKNYFYHVFWKNARTEFDPNSARVFFPKKWWFRPVFLPLRLPILKIFFKIQGPSSDDLFPRSFSSPSASSAPAFIQPLLTPSKRREEQDRLYLISDAWLATKLRACGWVIAAFALPHWWTV
jgi:hypothetical protein